MRLSLTGLGGLFNKKGKPRRSRACSQKACEADFNQKHRRNAVDYTP